MTETCPLQTPTFSLLYSTDNRPTNLFPFCISYTSSPICFFCLSREQISVCSSICSSSNSLYSSLHV